ncbi:MAG: ATP-binding cassette domain-containing protein [Oscillospiraceae bacterium]|jgi:D-methionine transport system ATP-binding protein|nr:ATP-binding cassette domain-containing protein [Oscillospiraceae bacterium]
MDRLEPIIRIQKLTKTFAGAGGGLTVLDNIDLDIYNGDVFGIIGVSGAGKSTLVRCINFLERPTSGTISFDGKDLNRLPEKALYKVRQSMGMIFQQFNLLMQRTALDNVCFPLEIAGKSRKESRVRAEALLELVELPDKARAYPGQLSGGQRQRVAIARALATDPKVLLCDEATSALDPKTTRGVLALLKEINRKLGVTVVVITHEMTVVEEICNKVAVIDACKIAETGDVSEVFIKPKSLAARKLFYPDDVTTEHFINSRCCRIVFDGNSSFEPVVADMVLRFRKTVNIIFADTKNIGGKAFGQMVLQLPEDDTSAEKMMEYLTAKGLAAEEVRDYV